MKRRSFIANLLASIGAPPWIPRAESASPAVAPVVVPPAYRFDRVALAGFQFHEGESAWAWLALGQPLDLVREPGNSHDANAIQVQWRGRLLGYVPRARNEQLAGLMDQGLPATARIAALSPGPDPWDRIGLDVTIGGAPAQAMAPAMRTSDRVRPPGGDRATVTDSPRVFGNGIEDDDFLDSDEEMRDEEDRPIPVAIRIDFVDDEPLSGQAEIAARIDGLRRQEDRVSRPFVVACAKHGDAMVEALRCALAVPRPPVESPADLWLRRHASTIAGLVATPSAQALAAVLADGPAVEPWAGYREIGEATRDIATPRLDPG